MRKNKVLLLAVFIFLALSAPLRAKEGSDDFANSALGKELITLGLKFLENPGDFFFNLHSDNEDFSPLPANRHGSIRFNFFPTFFPTTWGNLNAKVKLLNDRGSVPQVDLVGAYGYLLALSAVEGDVKPQFSDYSVGLVVSKATAEKTRLFGGVKYSAVNMDVTFSTPVALGAFEMSSLNFQVADLFFLTGITHQYSPTSSVLAQVGYGFKYNKILSRIMLSHRHLELGLDIYPEGLFAIHPFMAWHWYF